MALGRRQLVSMLTVLLCLGFMVTALVNYVTARNLIRESIIGSELPLTSDNIYSEIQKDLVRPIFISSMMAGDTFLRDWMLAGEKDISKISRYLAEVKQRYGAHTSFLVSDRTRNYYQAEGLLKQVSPEAERDVWYYRVRGLTEPYEINVDPDMANKDDLTIFVNYRVLDYQDNLLGATGVGLTVDSVRGLINEYQERYHRTIYFVNPQGRLTLFAGEHALGKNIAEIEGLKQIADGVLQNKDGGTFEYRACRWYQPPAERSLHSGTALVPVCREARGRGAERCSEDSVPEPADQRGGDWPGAVPRQPGDRSLSGSA